MATNHHNHQHEADGVENIEAALTSTEQFIEKNRRWLLYGIIVIIAVVSGYIAYQNFVVRPRNSNAQEQAIFAQQQFAKDSFNVALNGDGNNLGFLQLIEDYAGTKIGNLAYYYAGVCYRNLGEYQKAIDFLQDYSLEDEMIAPIALGAMGDCYVELGQENKAIEQYQKAVGYTDNILTAPIFLMKQGILFEKAGKWNEALGVYKTIKDSYPESQQAREVAKFIARAEQQGK